MKTARQLPWMGALAVAGLGAYALLVQPGPAIADHDDECPMHEMAELSTVKVEQTKQGAIIQLMAKKPEDVGKVQQQAKRVAAMLTSGSCPMHAEHGGMHHHHHHHQDAPAPTPKPKP